MDFALPAEFLKDRDEFKAFIKEHVSRDLALWSRDRTIPAAFFQMLGKDNWFGFEVNNERLSRKSALRAAILTEELARVSPGTAVAVAAHIDLGLIGIFRFGSEALRRKYGAAAVAGKTLLCLGNSEPTAGSDVAGISMTAAKVEGGWRLNGTKAYVTNGNIADLAIVTAVSEPDADRTRRMSMYLADLHADGIRRKKLNKQVWIPSDLTRLQFADVFVADDHLLGRRGRGMQQLLEIFTASRVAIAAITLGTAAGAFDLAQAHMRRRNIFGRSIAEFQAKAFEAADFYARLESARLMLWKACWQMDNGLDFRLESSMAKYLAVQIARELTAWAADIFGAASVMPESPIHKYPLDAWAASLGEGTQDIQKLIIFRELMKKTQ